MKKIFVILALAGCASSQLRDQYQADLDREHRATFAKMYSVDCPGDPKRAGCADLYKTADMSTPEGMKSYNARLAFRYLKANVNQIVIWCQGYPQQCLNPQILELQFLSSHNQAVIEEGMMRIDQINNAYLDQAQKDRLQQQQVWSNIFPTNQNRRISCTSYTTGNFTNTNCN